MLAPPTLSPRAPTLALTPDLAALISAHLSAPADHAALALTCRAGRAAGQRALFAALRLDGAPAQTAAACAFLATHPRLGAHVDALAVFVGDDDGSSVCSSGSDASMASAPPEPPPLPEDFWPTVRAALSALPRLRFLTLYISTSSPDPPTLASLCTPHLLAAAPFSLLSLHADLAWDADLAGVLAAHPRLGDLYLADWTPAAVPLGKAALGALHVLDCTEPEAAAALVPGRPVSYVRTEFMPPCGGGSMDVIPAQADEDALSALLDALSHASAPLRSLALAHAPPSLPARILSAPLPFAALRFVGTLPLPVASGPRLRTYGALRALPLLRAAALDVRGWPRAAAARLPALAKEAAVYAPGLRAVVLESAGAAGLVVRRRPGGMRWWTERGAEGVWREV